MVRFGFLLLPVIGVSFALLSVANVVAQGLARADFDCLSAFLAFCGVA